FSIAYHTYFLVSDISEVRVEGLETLDYLDNLHHRERFTEQGDALTFETEVDRVYVVVWNPWEKKARAIQDMGDEEYRQTICVDGAAVEKPITLKPGEEWTGRLELSALPLCSSSRSDLFRTSNQVVGCRILQVFEVELHGAQGDREAEVFQVSKDDTAMAQRRLEDKQPEEKTNTDCLVKEQEKEYQTGWKIKTGNVLDSCNQMSTQQCMKNRVAKHLGVAGIQNIGFNESEKYKKTFIGSGVGTGSMQVLHGFEFEVEPLGDHKFELARDREQHLACDLFEYREDSNEDALAVAAVDKIYAHESLNFNDTVACEVISKWKAGLEKDMMFDQMCMCSAIVAEKAVMTAITITRSMHQGLLDKAKGNVLGMEIIRDQSEGSLSKDYDVEKNGKWSCIYAVGSQEYQMVCTRLDIASADVDGMVFSCGFKAEIWVTKGLLDKAKGNVLGMEIVRD
nr:putative glucose-6-phosphate 1-epimerase isoform X1 [Tanacetum cinerariifolium]